MTAITRVSSALAVAIVAHASTARADDPPRTTHTIITVAGVALFIATESSVLKQHLASSSCWWCDPPWFDRDVRSSLVWHDKAAAGAWSSRTALGSGALALGLTIAAFHSSFGRGVDGATQVIDAGLASLALVELAQFTVDRKRPDARFTPCAAPTLDDNTSFFSAHTAGSFALVTAALVLAHQQHSRTEPYLWTLGYGLAAATAYLRIAADKHYLSDVVVGAAVGIGMGIAVPLIEQHASVVETGRPGIAFASQF